MIRNWVLCNVSLAVNKEKWQLDAYNIVNRVDCNSLLYISYGSSIEILIVIICNNYTSNGMYQRFLMTLATECDYVVLPPKIQSDFNPSMLKWMCRYLDILSGFQRWIW